MRSSNRLCQGRPNIDRLNLVTNALLILMWHCIRNDNSTQTALPNNIDRLSREYPMHHNRIYFDCTIRLECFSGLGERAAGIGHVVHEDGDFAVDIAHQGHFRDFVCAETFFVDECKGEIETVGDGSGTVC